MRKIHSILPILIFLVSCNGKVAVSETKQAKPIEKQLTGISGETFNGWMQYYKQRKSGFSIENFTFETRDDLDDVQGTIYGNFDPEFDPVYSGFLVFSPNRKNYIDFDSYNWVLNENQVPEFSVDQEINLVNIMEKTINRIAFYGSSAWVEDAFWENDSTVVLLGNSSDGVPFISIVDLNQKKSDTFKYSTPLDFKSDYSLRRLGKKK